MLEFGILVISALLSTILFSLLFYGLNYKVSGIFKPIQNKIDILNAEKKRKFKTIINIVGIIIVIILPIFHFNDVLAGLIIGLLLSLKDICFRENIIEIALKN